MTKPRTHRYIAVDTLLFVPGALAFALVSDHYWPAVSGVRSTANLVVYGAILTVLNVAWNYWRRSRELKAAALETESA